MPRFSIVVPAYNVAQYIEECLNSLISQTYQDFEIICVNDASTDNTLEILNRYSAEDTRVRVVTNEENMHLYASRHIGTAETTGEYVLFVDADDKLTHDALEALDAQLSKRPVDILQFELVVVPDAGSGVTLEKGAWYDQAASYGPIYLEGKDILNHVCYQRPQDMCTHHRVFRGDLVRSVFRKLGNKKGIFAQEDIVEQIALLLECTSYEAVSPAPYYIYNLGRGMSRGDEATSLQEFTRTENAKWACFETCIEYLDTNHLHHPGIDEPVFWRWRLSCISTLYSWKATLTPEDRLKALDDFSGRWPLAWTLPMLYQFAADEIDALLSDDEEAQGARQEHWQELCLLMDAIAMLYKRYQHEQQNANNHDSGVLPSVSPMQLGSADVCPRKSTSLDMVLTCLRATLLFNRDQLWAADDYSVHTRTEIDFLKSELDRVYRELWQAQAEAGANKAMAEEVLASKSYRLGHAITSPARALLRRG